MRLSLVNGASLIKLCVANDHLPQLGHDMVAVFLMIEVACQALGRNVGESFFGINACEGKIERRPVNIGGKDLYIRPPAGNFHLLVEQDGERVSLFPRGTAGDPNTNFFVVPDAANEFRQHVLFKLGEPFGIAKEGA